MSMYVINFQLKKRFMGFYIYAFEIKTEGEGRDIADVMNEVEGRLEKESVRQKV
jgi:hypothetical protein